MAKVDVLLNLVQNVKKEIKKVEKNLDKLDKKNLTANLDVDDNGDIKQTEAELKALARDRTANIKANVDKGSKKRLQSDIVDLTEGSDNVWRFNHDTLDNISPDGTSNIGGGGGGSLVPDDGSRSNLPDNYIKNLRRVNDFKKENAKSSKKVSKNTSESSNSLGKAAKSAKNVKKAFSDGDDFSFGFRKFIPKISMWYNLIGAILPLVVSLGAAFAGLAVSLGAVVGAGAGFIGLGLLGHGEGIADSMALAKRRVNELKRELFRAMKPVTQAFAPISDRFFSSLTKNLQPLIDSLEGLTVFEDTFFNMFKGAVGWVTDLVDSVVRMKDEIDASLNLFSGVGQALIQFLEWSVQVTAENQDMFRQFAQVIENVIVIIYHLSNVFSRAVVSLTPLLTILEMVSKLLDTKFGTVLMSTAAWILVLTKAVQSLAIMMTGAFISSIKYAIGGLVGYISYIWSAISATSKLLSLLAATGVGLAVIGISSSIYETAMAPGNSISTGSGGSMTSGAGGNRGGAPVYNTSINVQGDPSNKQIRKMEDVADRINQRNEDESNTRSI